MLYNDCMRSQIIFGALVTLVAIQLDGCKNGTGTEPDPLGETGETAGFSTEPMALADIGYWAYQIQYVNAVGAADALVDSSYDMVVVEPTRTDWSDESRDFDTRGFVNRLKASRASDGEHRKLVIAYIDIGEAEDWRWYWTWSKDWPLGASRPGDWPDFIVTRDPDGWGGNYPVAYWDSRWKDIVIYGTQQTSEPHGDYTSVIDEVIKDGFDGIYLDWVEAFEDEDVAAAARRVGKDPAAEMIAFIREMAAYGAARNPNFLIIQQNGAALAEGRPEAFTVVDAIAQEHVWYRGEATDDWEDEDGYDIAIDPEDTEYFIEMLDEYLFVGVPVFNCEYALTRAATAYQSSYLRGYVPYATRVSLAKLTTTPPPDLSP